MLALGSGSWYGLGLTACARWGKVGGMRERDRLAKAVRKIPLLSLTGLGFGKIVEIENILKASELIAERLGQSGFPEAVAGVFADRLNEIITKANEQTVDNGFIPLQRANAEGSHPTNDRPEEPQHKSK